MAENEDAQRHPGLDPGSIFLLMVMKAQDGFRIESGMTEPRHPGRTGRIEFGVTGREDRL